MNTTHRLIFIHSILDGIMDEDLLLLANDTITELLTEDNDMIQQLLSQKDSDHYKEVKNNHILNYGFMTLNLATKVEDSNEMYTLVFKIRILNKTFMDTIDNSNPVLLLNKYKLIYFNIQDEYSVFREYFEKKN